jgi:5-methylcytosine-specific restriction protein B
MSLGNTQSADNYIYDDCIDSGLALLGYGRTIDFSGSRSVDDIARKFQESGVEVSADAYAVTAVSNFVLKMQPGDLLVVTDGNLKFRAIGEVVGDYAIQQRADHYGQSRAVRWLRVYSPSLPYEQIMKKQFSQMTLYELKASAIDVDKLSSLLSGGGAATAANSAFTIGQQFGQGYKVTRVSSEIVELDKPNGGQLPMPLSIVRQLAGLVSSGKISLNDIRQGSVFEKLGDSRLEKYIVNGYQSLIAAMVQAQLADGAGQNQVANARVLIIDEINRGNISRIFGELITLIEPSKRADSEESLEVTLPYSKERFSVPHNVYLIGTMNTADRSLAGFDIALRRRFVFHEMPPKPELLDGVAVAGVSVGELLRVLNQRIEVLLDRDHCLGHAYFMSLKDGDPLENLGIIFKNQILPLLQEYFFEDWQRIQWVLNDHRKAVLDQFIRKPASNISDLFGDSIEVGGHGVRWEINGEAFMRIEAYRGVINAVESSQP